MILFTHQSTSSSLTQKSFPLSCTLPAPLPCTVRTRPSRRSNPCSAAYYRNILTMQTRNLVKTKLSIPHEYRCHQNSLRFSVGSYYTIVIRKQSRLLLKAEFQSEFQLELLKKSTALCFNDKIPT